MRHLCTLATLTIAGAASAAEFSIFELPGLGGTGDPTQVSPGGISPDGRFISGIAADTSGFQRPFRWTTSSGTQALSIPGTSSSYNVVGVNNLGQTAGTWYAGNPRAYRWNGTSSVLLPLAANTYSFMEARDINGNGSVVGRIGVNYSSTPSYAAFRSNGTSTILLNSSDQVFSNFMAISLNDSNLAAGTGLGLDGWAHAFRWSSSGARTRLAEFENTKSSQAIHVRSNGEIVGYQMGQDNKVRTTIWKPDNTFTHLQWNGAEVQPIVANDAGWIFAGAESGNVLYRPDVGFQAIDSLVSSEYSQVYITGIAETGQMTGLAMRNGAFRAIRLDPVPEPASFAAIGLGMAAFLGRRRRARK